MKFLIKVTLLFYICLSSYGKDRISTFNESLKPLLDKHCLRCHGGEKVKANLDFSIYKSSQQILENSSDFIAIKESLVNHDMPPKPKKTNFTDIDRQKILTWVEENIESNDFSNPVYMDPGPSSIRQLTTFEYNRTVQDLLGVEFNINKELGVVKEKNIHAFSTLATSLTVSPLLMEKYFTAADKVSEKLLADSKALNLLFKNMKKNNQSAYKLIAKKLSFAYRRKASKSEIKKHYNIYLYLIKKKKPFREAVVLALKPILVSPFFLNRIEENRAPRNSQEIYKVSNLELASRLSYFLWSTMPDLELVQLAVKKKLHNQGDLTSSIRRMLKSPKSSALAEGFMAEWLGYDGVLHALPGTDVYPDFNNDLKSDFRAEVVAFIKDVVENDLSVLNFIDSDFTYLNKRLAKHYNIPGIDGDRLQKFSLAPRHNRGGVLGMGAILAMTSHTNRTKPTARGKWIAEVMLGTTIPEPPDDVEGIEDNSEETPLNFREQLERHAANAACSVCHKKMDPLGFALENYNAVGQWRTSVNNQKINSSGILPDGTQVDGIASLKKTMLKNKDQFVKNLFSKMLSYAIGRNLDYYDELTILKAVKNIKSADYKFSSIVLEVIKSRPFLYRKNIENYHNSKTH
ncbi:MAG: DUF1592 domain-containing protein [Lentisphaeraceae bacterium]|nr:DUF1592 domain-containing protein [Lentisphaeraceae bacterium]